MERLFASDLGTMQIEHRSRSTSQSQSSSKSWTDPSGAVRSTKPASTSMRMSDSAVEHPFSDGVPSCSETIKTHVTMPPTHQPRSSKACYCRVCRLRREHDASLLKRHQAIAPHLMRAGSRYFADRMAPPTTEANAHRARRFNERLAWARRTIENETSAVRRGYSVSEEKNQGKLRHRMYDQWLDAMEEEDDEENVAMESRRPARLGRFVRR